MTIGPALKSNYQRHLRTEVLPRAQKILESFLDRDTPYKTGALLHSRKITVSGGGPNLYSLTITYPTKVANYTDEGTRAHRITARRAKALRFVVGGRVVFAKSVMWRPGPGVARNKNWFKKSVAVTRWRTILGQVLGR